MNKCLYEKIWCKSRKNGPDCLSVRIRRRRDISDPFVVVRTAIWSAISDGPIDTHGPIPG